MRTMIFTFGDSMMPVRLSGCIDFCLAEFGDVIIRFKCIFLIFIELI